MKRKYQLYLILFALAVLPQIGCSDWTEVEAEDYFEMPSEEYYAALRKYKKSPHQIAFGWFGNWSGEGASLVNSLAGIPDSVDVVSIWGNWSNLTTMQKKDMEFCQQKKGTRFTLCFIIQNIGDQITPRSVYDTYKEEGFSSESEAVKYFWGWKEGNEEAIAGAIRQYAKAIVDTIHKYNYDGFDIDYEPHFGHSGSLAGNNGRMMTFVDELGKYLGPKSGSGKLLIVDGEPQSMPSESGTYFDYFIIQSYYSPGDIDLDNRLLYRGPAGTPSLVSNFIKVMDEEEITRKLVVTENFEAVDVAMNGGYNFVDRDGNKMKSLEGMARWKPENGFEKGGVGTYHMEAEYPANPEYKNLRRVIQIMNPSPYPLERY